MKAIEINNFFISKGNWINRNTTVDRVIIGDPNKEIKTILVTWMSDLKSINAAIEGGYDMLLTHEPTFWIHANEVRELENWEEDFAKKVVGLNKKKMIEESGLVILRNHDLWDRMPELGMPWSLARFLGMGEKPVCTGEEEYQHRYDIEPITLGKLARDIAAKTAMLGEPYVQVAGDEDTIVSKIGIGTGCCCSIPTFINMGCDISIVCDDGTSYWSDLKFAMDAGHPFIRINHGTSEEPGMVTLTEYINNELKPIKAVYLPHKFEIKVIGGK
jgi:putative NIF3 family GTP cyclohydrolase 1 type 2